LERFWSRGVPKDSGGRINALARLLQALAGLSLALARVMVAKLLVLRLVKNPIMRARACAYCAAKGVNSN